MSKRMIRTFLFCSLSLLLLAPLHNARASRWPFTTAIVPSGFAGQLTTGNDTWNRMTTINVLSGQQVFYEIVRIRIQTGGQYTITINSTGFAGALNTYAIAFNPALPQTNFWDNGIVAGNPGQFGQTVFFAPGQYEIVISTNLAGQTGTFTGTISGPGTVTIDPPPPLSIQTNPFDTTITPGQTATLLISTAGRAPKNFQWFQGESGDTSNLISGATGASFTTPALFAETRYWVRVGNPDGTVDSGTATVFVTNGPVSFTGALTACDDRFNRPAAPGVLSGQVVFYKLFRFRVSTSGNYTFSLQTSGFQGAFYLYDQIFLPNDPKVNLAGISPTSGNPVTFSQTLLAGSGVQQLVIASTNAGATGSFTLTVTGGPALITKLPAPEITTQPANVNINRGQPLTLSVGTNSPNVSFQWFTGNCSNKTAIPGAIAASFTPAPLTKDQTFLVRLDNPGGYVFSSVASVTILPLAGDLNTDPIAQNKTLTVAAPGVLRNATAADGRTLTAIKATNPAHGSLTFNANGSFVYQPAANYVGPDSFTFRVADGVHLSNIATVNLTVMPTFANNTPFTIPSSGPASLYPSTINISGLSGNVSKLIVTLNMLHHENQGDLDILLVGPLGQALILMSDANGDADNPFVFDRVISFDDAAIQTIPDGQALFDGTYRPVNYGGGDSFPSPAPATFSSPAPAGSATLTSVFNGTDPNGAWKLFVFDDQGFSSGSLPGWSLTIGTGAGCPQFTITPPTLPEAALNTAFPTTTLTASGGTGLYTFQITAGSLPNGMNFTTDGVLSGTPSQPGIFNFTVTATDQNGCTWQRVYTLNVACPVVTVRVR